MPTLQPPPDDADRIERALGWRPSTYRPAATSRGATASAARWIVLGGKRSAFVKIGATEVTARLFRREIQNYETIQAPFMPQVLGFFDDGVRPVLALEDLSSAHWPPPWTKGQVQALLDVLGELHDLRPPRHLERVRRDGGASWRAVAEDPGRWAALGLCSMAWLEDSLPRLISAAAEAALEGEALVHLDVRGDNVCFRGEDVILLDWPEAAIANPDLDVAFWLPSLQADGGPPPESILPKAPEIAAWVAGFSSRGPRCRRSRMRSTFGRCSYGRRGRRCHGRRGRLTSASDDLPLGADALWVVCPSSTDESSTRFGPCEVRCARATDAPRWRPGVIVASR